MYVATVRNQSCSMRLRGKNAELRNSRTKNSGKKPCTASPVPARSATYVPKQANANEIAIASAMRTNAPPTPLAIPAPNATPTTRYSTALMTPMNSAPPSWPASSAAPDIGVIASRSRKPPWMSRARSWPPLSAANRAPCMNGIASAKSR